MKNITIIALSLVVAACSSSSDRGDEYDYIDTPIADQWADHQDDDSDGVINQRDLCPGTPLGAEIDNDAADLTQTHHNKCKFECYLRMIQTKSTRFSRSRFENSQIS